MQTLRQINYDYSHNLSFSTRRIKENTPTRANAIVGVFICILGNYLHLGRVDLPKINYVLAYLAGVITTSIWLPDASKLLKKSAIFCVVKPSTAAL